MDNSQSTEDAGLFWDLVPIDLRENLMVEHQPNFFQGATSENVPTITANELNNFEDMIIQHDLTLSENPTTEYETIPDENSTTEHEAIPDEDPTTEHEAIPDRGLTTQYEAVPNSNPTADYEDPDENTTTEHEAIPDENPTADYEDPDENPTAQHEAVPNSNPTTEHEAIPDKGPTTQYEAVPNSNPTADYEDPDENTTTEHEAIPNENPTNEPEVPGETSTAEHEILCNKSPSVDESLAVAASATSQEHPIGGEDLAAEDSDQNEDSTITQETIEVVLEENPQTSLPPCMPSPEPQTSGAEKAITHQNASAGLINTIQGDSASQERSAFERMTPDSISPSTVPHIQTDYERSGFELVTQSTDDFVLESHRQIRQFSTLGNSLETYKGLLDSIKAATNNSTPSQDWSDGRRWFSLLESGQADRRKGTIKYCLSAIGFSQWHASQVQRMLSPSCSQKTAAQSVSTRVLLVGQDGGDWDERRKKLNTHLARGRKWLWLVKELGCGILFKNAW
ncbi:hypothetical protein ACHAPT_010757 [Fusarium lateritium]